MILISELFYWVVNFLYYYFDGDFFLKVLEIDVIYNMVDEFVE